MDSCEVSDVLSKEQAASSMNGRIEHENGCRFAVLAEIPRGKLSCNIGASMLVNCNAWSGLLRSTQNRCKYEFRACWSDGFKGREACSRLGG